MNADLVQKIADAVLYEGYMLYPYRPSSVKNRQRWTFGGLYPRAYASTHSEPFSMQSEFLVESDEPPQLNVKVRFLHLLSRECCGRSWQEAMPRDITLCDLNARQFFTFPAMCHPDGDIVRKQMRIDGEVNASVENIAGRLYKVTLRVINTTDFSGTEVSTRDEASLQALVSTHAIVQTETGELVSMTDPPEHAKSAAAACENVGVWPVLAGDPGSRDCILVSPIILSDYPEVAPESPGDLFDGAEIDEILTLRILTMTEDEKREMRQVDERTSRILERTEGLSAEEIMRLHGALRNPHGVARRL